MAGVGDWLSENILGNDKRYPGARTKAGNSVVEEGINALDGAINSAIGISPENNFLTGPYGFTKQPRKYYLEIRKGEKIITVTGFPYDPQSMIVSRPNPITVTHTFGGTVREASSIRMHRVQFDGRSGTAIRNGFNRDGYAIFRTGQTIFKEFDDFLKRYIEMCNSDFGTKAMMTTNYPDMKLRDDKRAKKLEDREEVQLILRCLDDDLHLKVEPINFDYRRNARDNRHDYGYTLTLDAYEYAYDTKPFNPVASLDNIVQNAVGQITGAVAIFDNAVQTTTQYTQTLKGTMRSLQNPAIAVGAAGRSIDQLKYSIAGFSKESEALHKAYHTTESPMRKSMIIIDATTPQAAIDQQEMSSVEPPAPASIEQAIIDAYNQALQIEILDAIAIGRGGVAAEYMRNLRLRSDDLIPGEFLTNEGNLGGLGGSTVDVAPDNGIPDNSIGYRCQRNEDLKKIAKKFLGSHDRWPLLAELNGMPDSRRKADGGILDTGDIVFIPYDGILGINSFNKKGDIYSADISMPYDDIVLISQDVNDFDLVEGIECLKQAVKNKLLTFKGEMPNYENMGLPRLTFINDVDYTAAQIREVLIKDPRVADVNNIIAQVEGDVVRIGVNVVALTGESFNVKV
jgi:hypothetical protein